MTIADTRRVRRVHMQAPSDTLLRRGLWLLEDALHTATLPGEDGRLVVVRSLAVGRIRSRRSPAGLALQIEDRFRKLAASAVHVEAPHAAQQPAVYFRSQVEAYALLAVRLAQGRAVDAWFWPLAVPVFRCDMPRDEALRQVFLAAAATPVGPLVTLEIVQTLLEAGRADALLTALRATDGETLLRASGWSLPPPLIAEPPADAPAERVAPAWRPLLARFTAAWGEGDARAIWLGATALLAQRPARREDPRVLQRAQGLLRTCLQPLEPRTGGLEVATDRGTRSTPQVTAPQRPPQRTYDDPPPAQREASNGPPEILEIRTAPLESVEESPKEALEPSSLWPAEARRSEYAGLFFLIPLMSRQGMAAAFKQMPEWADLDLPRQVLQHVARFLRIPEADPCWHAIATEDPPTPELIPLLDAWVLALRRACVRDARLSLRQLVRRPGRLLCSRTHIDLFFPLHQVSLRVRRAGLDLNPGWVPWIGRVVQSHYFFGGFDV